MTTVFKAVLMSTAFLTYSFIESSDVVATRYPIMVSIVHLSLIGWPLLSIVSQQYNFMEILKSQIITIIWL